MSENLTLWEKVCTTDPKYTKSFSRSGGFSGTAINALYLVRKATEQWGPIGGKWGFEVEDEKYVPGASETVVHVLRIKFRHPDGWFHAYGQTTFVGKNKHGAYTDEEAPKKSLTDAMTKALSLLGFSADVHIGLYDDNKYVNDLKKKFAEEQGNGEQRIEEQIISANVQPNAGAGESLTPEEKEIVERLAHEVIDCFVAEQPETAYEVIEEAKLSGDQKLFLWSKLDSKQRSALKKIAKAHKETEMERETAGQA